MGCVGIDHRLGSTVHAVRRAPCAARRAELLGQVAAFMAI